MSHKVEKANIFADVTEFLHKSHQYGRFLSSSNKYPCMLLPIRVGTIYVSHVSSLETTALNS